MSSYESCGDYEELLLVSCLIICIVVNDVDFSLILVVILTVSSFIVSTELISVPDLFLIEF